MIWKEQNRRVFGGIESNFDNIKNVVSYLSFVLRGHPYYLSTNIGDLINILIDI